MIDLATKLLIAFTASGSAIAGWSLWNTPGGKFFWVMIAGVASISSIANGVMGVPTRVKEQEEIRQVFLKPIFARFKPKPLSVKHHMFKSLFRVP